MSLKARSSHVAISSRHIPTLRSSDQAFDTPQRLVSGLTDLRPNESGIKDFLAVRFARDVPVGPFVASFENVTRVSVSCTHRRNHGIRTDFEQESLQNLTQPWVLSTRRAQPIQEFERKCFRDFLVLEFILMRVLKSEKMIGGQILCSFFVSDDNRNSWSKGSTTSVLS
ncbi:hypothetical protein Tco_1379088 [Tanacetum coccineum]